MLVNLPAWIIPIFVEYDDRAWHDAFCEQFENRLGRGI